MGQDERVRQVRLVVVPVVAAADDGVAVVVEDLGHRDGYPVADYLPGYPTADGLGPPEFPVHVVDQGVATIASSSNALTAAMNSAKTGAKVVVSVISVPSCALR